MSGIHLKFRWRSKEFCHFNWKVRAAKSHAALALKHKRSGNIHDDKMVRPSLPGDRPVARPAIVLLLTAATSPARSDDLITTRKLSAALAAEVVTEAVASCARQGLHVSAAVLNVDGLAQAILRGDRATETSFEIANDKAYTAIMLGATHNEDSTGAIVDRMVANPNDFLGFGQCRGLGQTAAYLAHSRRSSYQGRQRGYWWHRRRGRARQR